MASMGLTAIIADYYGPAAGLVVFARVGLVSGLVGMAANIVAAVAYPQR